MSPAKVLDYFAPTAKRLAAEQRSDMRRELIAVADRRSHLALKMSLAAGVTEDVLTLPAWDDEWDGNTARRIQHARRKADLVWEQALDFALEAIAEATAPALTDTQPETENTETPDDPSTAKVSA